MVNAMRDKPQLPSADDLAELQADRAVAAFLRNEPGVLKASARGVDPARAQDLQTGNVRNAVWASALLL